MSEGAFLAALEQGKMILPGQTLDVAQTPWNPHPAFKGVFLKHLLKGADSGGLFSCHLVRVDPGQEIGTHLHEGRYELHEVVAGRGVCQTMGQELEYIPGVSALMPPDVDHRIIAGDEGLWIMAKFMPALV
ncbi:MAG: cupin domain-containing protein [Pseudomonadota bacterium]